MCDSGQKIYKVSRSLNEFQTATQHRRDKTDTRKISRKKILYSCRSFYFLRFENDRILGSWHWNSDINLKFNDLNIKFQFKNILFITQLQVVLSLAICLGQTKPADFGELEYDNVPRDSHERDDSHETDEPLKDSNDGNVYDTGVFTKYPESPTDDEYYSAANSRQKRNTSTTDADGEHDALDLNQLFFDKVYNVSRPERNSGEKQSEIPLNGLISAIQTELVDSAEKINSEVSKRKQRSAETTPQTETEKPSDSDDDDDDDSIDVNKNFFDGIFEFTRSQRETAKEPGANKTIPLKGLVDAVESTLVNSAKKLQNPPKKSSGEKVDKTAVDAEANERKTRSAEEGDDDDDDDKVEVRSHIGVEKVSPNKNIDLDLLNPITFKSPTSESADSHESTESTDEVSSTTLTAPVQPTNLTLVHTSNRTHIVPNADNKTAHLQQQQITQTVFHSTLAILPTISPNNINVPEISSNGTTSTTATTISQTSETDAIDAVTDKTADSPKHSNENQETEKLKVKVAEVAANPVILSQGI